MTKLNLGHADAELAEALLTLVRAHQVKGGTRSDEQAQEELLSRFARVQIWTVT